MRRHVSFLLSLILTLFVLGIAYNGLSTEWRGRRDAIKDVKACAECHRRNTGVSTFQNSRVVEVQPRRNCRTGEHRIRLAQLVLGDERGDTFGKVEGRTLQCGLRALP